MHFIDSLNETRFTLNGAEYLRNYVSAVRAGKVEIFNCYETKDVLVPLSHPGEISVNGSEYDDALQLQSALQDVIFSRSNLGGSMEGQNNKGRIVSLGRIADTSLAYAADKANQFRITILETECPVLFTGIRPNGRSSMKYYYLFLGGKGSWGTGGSDVLASHLVMLTSERVTPLLLFSEDNTLIHNLGSVRESEFLRTVNSSVWDFRETITANYFSYGENVSAYKIFSGKPGIYGGDQTEFTEENFELVTDDTVTPGASTPNLEEVLNSGGVANVTGPFSVTVGSNSEGGNLILDGGEFRAGNSNGFMFGTGGDFRVGNGGNISLDCSKLMKLNGGQGFSFEGGGGGSIVADPEKGITISGRAGGINLLGNALGVVIDGQGGEVVINSPNGIELKSGEPIRIESPLLLTSQENAPLVFGQDYQKDPALIRESDGSAIRVVNGKLRAGGSSFDTDTNIASKLTVGNLITAWEVRSQMLTGTGPSGHSDSNSIYLDAANHDMLINAKGDITIGSSANESKLTIFRDVNIYGKGGYWFGVQSGGPIFNAKEVLVNGLPLTTQLTISSSAGVTLSGAQGLLLTGGKNGIILQDAPAQYKEDYSSKFTDRSIVDKAYVDRRASKLVSVTGDIVDNTDPKNPVVRVPSLKEVTEVDSTAFSGIRMDSLQLHDPADDDYKVIRVNSGKCYMQRTVKGKIVENSFEFSGELQNFVFPEVGGELATKEWVENYTKLSSPLASSTESGITKLYNQLGIQTDGAIDQATITNQLSLKANLVAPVFTGPVTIASGGLTITGGGTSTYMRGDGTTASFVTAVRAATVSGGTGSLAFIASGNTVDNAIWQLQNQVKAVSAFTVKSAAYIATAADNTIACNGTFTLTLPSTGIVAGKRYLVKNTGTGKITIILSSGGTIDGTPSFEVSTQWSGAEFTFDGTNYLITSVF